MEVLTAKNNYGNIENVYMYIYMPAINMLESGRIENSVFGVSNKHHFIGTLYWVTFGRTRRY